MARTTVSDVRDILETQLTDPEVQTFIDDASLKVDAFASDLASSDVAEAVERYYAADLIGASDPEEVQVKMGETTVKYSETGRRYFTRANELSGGLLESHTSSGPEVDVGTRL